MRLGLRRASPPARRGAAKRQLIIRTATQARRRRVVAAGLGAALLVAGWGLYLLGRVQAPTPIQRQIAAQQKLDSNLDELLIENRRLRDETRTLSRQLAMLERAAKIDQAASVALRESINEMQSRIAAMKKDLAFYRGIVSPAEAEAGLRVQKLVVSRAEEANVYRLHLILIQAVRHDDKISGQIRVRVEGLLGGESVSFTWADIAVEPASTLGFSFRYFQKIDTMFKLPGKVDPTLVEVEVVNDDSGEVTQTYRWQEIFEAQG